jgi:phosphatidylserine/phosphatidylglycerophosphate/cardiolipin synthase-like enzyme
MKFLKLFAIIFVVQILVSCNANPGFEGRLALPGVGDSGDGLLLETAAGESNWYEVYFSEPDSPASSTLRGGPDSHLAEAIDQARLSVDIAIDSLDLWSIRDALLEAYRRGVAVRVVIENEGLESEQVQDLIASGIQVVNDQGEGLMHNKFTIIDRREVFSGSMNYTLNGAYRSDNNLIRIESADLAEDYLVEFEEMFLDHQFGSGSPSITPHPIIDVSGTELEVYFSPDDATMERVIELVQSAQESVFFLGYSFTDDDLAAALINANNSGIEVKGVLDKAQALSNAGGEYQNLLESSIDVRLDGNPKSMHHKVIIIDVQIVVTGSYNFSKSAKTRNDENTLILHNPEIAAIYMEEFERVWGIAE